MNMSITINFLIHKISCIKLFKNKFLNTVNKGLSLIRNCSILKKFSNS